MRIAPVLNLAVLTNRSFLALFGGALISRAGDAFYTLLLPMLIYERLGSTMALSGMFIVLAVPPEGAASRPVAKLAPADPSTELDPGTGWPYRPLPPRHRTAYGCPAGGGAYAETYAEAGSSRDLSLLKRAGITWVTRTRSISPRPPRRALKRGTSGACF